MCLVVHYGGKTERACFRCAPHVDELVHRICLPAIVSSSKSSSNISLCAAAPDCELPHEAGAGVIPLARLAHICCFSIPFEPLLFADPRLIHPALLEWRALGTCDGQTIALIMFGVRLNIGVEVRAGLLRQNQIST